MLGTMFHQSAIRCTLTTLLSITAIHAAAVVTTTTFCTTNLGTSSYSPSCYLTGTPDGLAQASGSASYSTSGNTLAVSVLDTARVSGTTGAVNGSGVVNVASAKTSMTLSVYTLGPVRSGYVYVGGGVGDVNSNTGGGLGFEYGTVDFSLSNSSGGVGAMCVPPNNTSCVLYNLAPITLGTSLNFDGDAYGYAGFYGTSVYGDGALGYGSETLNLQFYEADGVTPVDVFAPEPATWSLLSAGLASLLIGVRWKRHRVDPLAHSSFPQASRPGANC